MSLIQCPECDAPISDKATKCPMCGYPVLATSVQKNIPKMYRRFIYQPVIMVFRAFRHLVRKFVKPVIAFLFLISFLIFLKNYYFISQAENLAWKACESTHGKDISFEDLIKKKSSSGVSTSYEYEIVLKHVTVPEKIVWYKLESRVDSIFHIDNFDFDFPYIAATIDIIGLSESGKLWECTPLIDKKGGYSMRPYKIDKIFRIEMLD